MSTINFGDVPEEYRAFIAILTELIDEIDHPTMTPEKFTAHVEAYGGSVGRVAFFAATDLATMMVNVFGSKEQALHGLQARVLTVETQLDRQTP